MTRALFDPSRGTGSVGDPPPRMRVAKSGNDGLTIMPGATTTQEGVRDGHSDQLGSGDPLEAGESQGNGEGNIATNIVIGLRPGTRSCYGHLFRMVMF
jgi:hypothetical protein